MLFSATTLCDTTMEASLIYGVAVEYAYGTLHSFLSRARQYNMALTNRFLWRLFLCCELFVPKSGQFH